MSRRRVPIRVAILVFPGPDAGDVFGPLDILRYATKFATEGPRLTQKFYQVEVASAERETELFAFNGLRLTAEAAYHDLKGPIDTLIITPIGEERLDSESPELIAWLRKIAPRVRRIVGLCTGSLPLAQAGLLDGRRATTHWKFCDAFAGRFPNVKVEPDRIFVRDGNTCTSAGASAGLDLMLALVEEDLGSDIARAVARFMVMFLKRPGGQSQFSALLDFQSVRSEPIRELQGWILDHLGGDLSIEALAEQAGMSERNFRRVFTREAGVTPAKFVEHARVETACRHLEETRETIETVASACGFGTGEQMRCAFLRTLGINPAAYRDRFATSNHAVTA